MTQTVYLKLSQITQVHEKNVPLASLGEVYCSEKSVESRCRAMIVKRIRGGGKQRESRLVGNVMEIIQQIEREIPGTSVQNLGETDYVIHYQPPRRQALVWQWCKTLFVCLICFFGAAFAIMTFNNDANVLDVFRKIYEITTGTTCEIFCSGTDGGWGTSSVVKSLVQPTSNPKIASSDKYFMFFISN